MFDEQRGTGRGNRYQVVDGMLRQVCERGACRAAVLSNDDGLFIAGWGGTEDELEALACGSPHVFIDAPRFSRTLDVAGQPMTLTTVDRPPPSELDAQLVRVLGD